MLFFLYFNFILLHLSVESSDENHPLYKKNSDEVSNIEVIPATNGNDHNDEPNNRNSPKKIVENFLNAESIAQTNGNKIYRPHSLLGENSTKNNFSNVHDLKAMSVASIYDKENQEMSDADK